MLLNIIFQNGSINIAGFVMLVVFNLFAAIMYKTYTTKISTPLHGPISYNSYSNDKFSCYKYALVVFNYFDILGDIITLDDNIVDSTNQSYEIVRDKRACDSNDEINKPSYLKPLFSNSETDVIYSSL